jgi:hypothetical protein
MPEIPQTYPQVPGACESPRHARGWWAPQTHTKPCQSVSTCGGAHPTQRSIEEADTSLIMQREKPESVSLIPGIFVSPQPELEEHILFVLHPIWAEKGDLL